MIPELEIDGLQRIRTTQKPPPVQRPGEPGGQGGEVDGGAVGGVLRAIINRYTSIYGNN